MSTTLTWEEILPRLALATFACALIGLDRSEHGRPAGLRTTLLVGLAATVAMIQANLLLATVGKAPDSFISLDPMRLPLGILTGVGFIGGGAILKRNHLTVGVTTAATLWFVTALGLCFGGGQYLLGLVALGLGLVVLSGLKWVERRLRRDRHATLIVIGDLDAPPPRNIRAILAGAGFELLSLGVDRHPKKRRRSLHCELRWRARPAPTCEPEILDELSRLEGVSRVKWIPRGQPIGLN